MVVCQVRGRCFFHHPKAAQRMQSNAQTKGIVDTSGDTLLLPAPTLAALGASFARDVGLLPTLHAAASPEGAIRHGPLLDPPRHCPIGGKERGQRRNEPFADGRSYIGYCGCSGSLQPHRRPSCSSQHDDLVWTAGLLDLCFCETAACRP